MSDDGEPGRTAVSSDGSHRRADRTVTHTPTSALPHWFRSWPIVGALVLGAVTVLVSVRQLYQVLAGARSTADQAIFELNVGMALEGVQRVGAYSQGFHHPGPAYFYWLALPYALLGRTTLSLHVGGQLLTFVFIALMILGATRWTASLALALVFVPVLGLELEYLGDFPLFDFWPPYAVLLGYASLLFLAAALAAGRWSALPGVAIVGSLLVQAHIAYALPIFGALALSVTCLLLRERSGLPGVRAAAGPIGAAIAALLVLLRYPVCAWAID